MAQIRIVDDWLRSPAAGPSHYRSVMVIAERWAEQRVLMRAYAESRDQLRPTIVLHGVELAIGPAGLDLNGPWGIHVGDNPDGRAQDIKHQLESSARRLSGSKGNPPRLADEEPPFEREPTANWGPGAPRLLPSRPLHAPSVEHVAPVGAARVPQVPAATYVPQRHAQAMAAPPDAVSVPSNPELRATPIPRARTRTTRHPPLSAARAQGQARTALGYTSGSGAQSAIVRLGLAPHVSARLGWLVDRVVPADFHIEPPERRVLNTLGEGERTAREIGQMLDVTDAVSFMEELTRKLESYNLDLIQPGEPQGGEPTYRLRG
ncbi:MAG TPA: hypothetical protein VFT22_38980 [Kofleriaceae bacterium]|nr:hypothetical protein [Kofleriaceae bacterium]